MHNSRPFPAPAVLAVQNNPVNLMRYFSVGLPPRFIILIFLHSLQKIGLSA
jgi:hypothetical protein